MATSVSRRPPSSAHPTRQQLDDLDTLLKRMLDLPVNRLEDEADDDAPPSAQERPSAPASTPGPMRGPHRPAFARPPEPPVVAPPMQYTTTQADEADLKPRVIIVAPNAPQNETDSAAEAAQAPSGGRSDDWVPLTSSWRPSSQTWKPLTEAWQQAQGANSAPAPNEAVEEEKRGGKESNRTGPLVEPTLPKRQSVDSPLPLFPPSPLLLSPASVEAPRPIPPASAPEGTAWLLWPAVRFNALFDACVAPFGTAGRWLSGPTGRALLGILGLLCLTAAIALAAADWIGWTS